MLNITAARLSQQCAASMEITGEQRYECQRMTEPPAYAAADKKLYPFTEPASSPRTK
jgi:hypothetical protein